MERYKVLGAMLSLKEFTVEDLANFSKVKANTVSTILARESSLIEELGKQQMGKRGGQFIKYGLKPEAADSLRTEINELVKSISGTITPETEFVPKEPLGLIAAEDGLTWLDEAESDEERRQILELARIDSQGARADLEALSIGGANPYAIGLFEERLAGIDGDIEKLWDLYDIRGAIATAAAEDASSASLEAASVSGTGKSGTLIWIGERVGRSIATVQNLATKRSFQRLTREWASFEEPREQVIVIDGIEEEPDPITSNLLRALKEQPIPVLQVPKEGLFKSLQNMQNDINRHSMCLLTVDSVSNPDQAERTCKQVFKSCRHSGGVVVFDNGSNPVLRNWMGHNHYIQYAGDLRQDVIMETINPFLRDLNRS